MGHSPETPISIRRRNPSSELSVVYAGASLRRAAFFKYVLPEEAAFTQVDGGQEPNIPNVKNIMYGKLESAKKQLNLKELAHKGTLAIVAADVRSSVLAPGS